MQRFLIEYLRTLGLFENMKGMIFDQPNLRLQSVAAKNQLSCVFQQIRDKCKEVGISDFVQESRFEKDEVFGFHERRSGRSVNRKNK